MRPRHRFVRWDWKRLVAVCLMTLLVALVIGCDRKAPAVFPDDATSTTIKAKPRQLANFGIALGPISGESPVRLMGVHPTGITPGLEVVAIRAFKPSEFGSGLGTYRGDLMALSHFKPYAVKGLVVPPGERLEWYLVVTMRASTFGTYLVRGATVTYEAAGRRGSQFLSQGMELKVVNCALPSDAFVCTNQPEPTPGFP